MENETYQISEAEQLTGEKAHVLRYWEEELGLSIGRNTMGHRFYTAEDIQIFLSIKELKKKGLHLKAIRELLPKLRQAAGQALQESVLGDRVEVEILPPKTELPGEKQDFQEAETVEVREILIPDEVLAAVPKPAKSASPPQPRAKRGKASENRFEVEDGKSSGDAREQKEEFFSSDGGADSAAEERRKQFYQILERLMRQLMMKKRQEERYKRVDEAIRKHQQSRKEAAVTAEQSPKRKKKAKGKRLK